MVLSRVSNLGHLAGVTRRVTLVTDPTYSNSTGSWLVNGLDADKQQWQIDLTVLPPGVTMDMIKTGQQWFISRMTTYNRLSLYCGEISVTTVNKVLFEGQPTSTEQIPISVSTSGITWQDISVVVSGLSGITEVYGDIIAGPGQGSVPSTLQSTTNVKNIIDTEIDGIHGDATVSYPNITLTGTGVIPGTYGSATAIPELTIDSKGRITSATTTPITTNYIVSGTLVGNTILSGVNTIEGNTTITGTTAIYSPTLTGTPIAPTAISGTNTTQIATTQFVQTAILPLATVQEVELTTVSGTQILSYTPSVAMNINIGLYFRVITATTNVTITINWTDGTGAQILTVLNSVPETVGSYSLTNFMINSIANNAVTINFTAATINQVYASASMRAA